MAGEKPVTIRGVRYGSRTAAAAALGMCVSAITKAERRGRLDVVGAQREAAMRPVTIQGVRYPSRAAAADALGVAPETVYEAIRLGTLDTVGNRPRLTEAQKRMVRDLRQQGWTLASTAAEVGCSVDTVRSILQRGVGDEHDAR